MKTLHAFADDLCIGAGLCLGGVGVYQVWPVGVWFYSAAAFGLVGWLIARGTK